MPLLAVLFVCRMAVFMMAPAQGNAMDLSLALCIEAGALLLLWWALKPLSWLLRTKPGLVVGAFACLAVVAWTLSQFASFAPQLLPDVPVYVLLLALLAAGGIAAFAGLPALYRTGFIIAGAVLAVLLLVALSLYGFVQARNLPPLLYDGWSPVWKMLLNRLPQNVELLAVMLLIKDMNGKKYTAFILASTAGGVSLTVLAAAVLGGMPAAYPFHAAVTAAQIGVFERVDMLVAGAWLSAMFVKVALFAGLCVHCVRQLLPASLRQRHAAIKQPRPREVAAKKEV
ncbi:MAG: GerAB/ArcD/ProY family transporter [Oscillospiraceae bacterium]|nr:GerAB/ArcD/ProY family transporter [Oscillospiraceae bacterium]